MKKHGLSVLEGSFFILHLNVMLETQNKMQRNFSGSKMGEQTQE